MEVFRTPGTFAWTPPSGCYQFDLILRGAGGGGNQAAGGGGGAAVDRFMVFARNIPDVVEIVVGAGGTNGQDGGSSSFWDVIANGGSGADNGGAGGLATMRGGAGGLSGTDGVSVTSSPIRLLAGGGGGAGLGKRGGSSGPFTGPGESPAFIWETSQSGGGGNPGMPGGFPAGGGGCGFGSGADGCVTIVEYMLGEYEP